MRRWLLLALLFAGATWAAGHRGGPREWKEPTEEEQNATAKPRRGLNSFNDDPEVAPKEDPVPWAAIGLGVLVLVVATPFALRAYSSTAKELKEATAFGNNGGHLPPRRRG